MQYEISQEEPEIFSSAKIQEAHGGLFSYLAMLEDPELTVQSMNRQSILMHHELCQ